MPSRPIIIVEQFALLREMWGEIIPNTLSDRSFLTFTKKNKTPYIFVIHSKYRNDITKLINKLYTKPYVLWLVDEWDYRIALDAERLKINDLHFSSDVSICTIIKILEKKLNLSSTADTWGRRWAQRWAHKKPFTHYIGFLDHERMQHKHLTLCKLLWHHKYLEDIVNIIGYKMDDLKRLITELYWIFNVDQIDMLRKKIFLRGLTH